jgi:uncharacterized oxidoreductase
MTRPVSDFVEAVFQQMIDKKVELTFGFSEVIAKATPEVVTATFNKMNPKPKKHIQNTV